MAYSQSSNDCATAELNPALSIASGTPATISFMAAWGDSPDYTPANAALVSDGFLRVNIPAGFYDVDFNATGGSTGEVSIGFGPDCSNISEVFSGIIGTDFPVACNFFAGGDQMLAISFEAGQGADFEITFTAVTPPANDDCPGAIELFAGTTTVDNTCAADGLVWYFYTVTNGSDLDFVVSDLGLSGAVLNGAFLNTCGGVDITNTWDCLMPGDLVYFEAGNSSPDHGTFDVTISDGTNGIANDECTGATMAGNVTCATPVSANGNLAACFDLEGTCPPTDLAAAGGIPENASSGVWYSITIDPSVPQFSFTGTTFEVFTGACGGLVSLGCEGDAALTGIDPAVNGTNYLVLVYDNGDFTATSDFSSPSNDLCANRLTVGSPGAGGSIDGTLVCAGNEYTITACNDEAQVFYTYTTGASKSDINISIASSTTTTGTAAGQLSFAVMETCGTLSTLPNASQCDVLDAMTVDFICVEPNTELIIMVESSSADAGDFSLTISETVPSSGVPSNDLCANAQAMGATASGTTECASNEHDICGATEFDNDYQTVYFSYTVSAPSANLSISVNGTGSPALSAGSIAFYDDCGTNDLGDEYDRINLTGLTCDFNTGLELVCVPAGTYTIAVGSSLAGEGSFDINVTETDASLPNDLCANAEAITSQGVTPGSNLCAGAETTICGLDGVTSHDVWYSLDPADFGFTSADFTINVGGTGTLPITDVNVAVFDGCGGIEITPSNVASGCASDNSDLIYSCISGPIVFVVASPDLADGEFNISISAVDAAPSNDDCSAAEFVGTNASVSSDNICASPDHNNCGGGDLNTDRSTVYFQYQTSGTDNIDLTINVSGGGNPISDASVYVFEADCTTPYNDPDAQDCAYALGSDIDIECIPAGTTIFVAVGSTLLGEGEFDISFTEVSATPPNDDCTNAEVLSNGVATPGTNECASLPVTGTPCDIDNESTVWYTYTVGPDDKEITIDVTGWTTGGADQISVSALQDNCISLTTLIQADGSDAIYCGSSGTDLLTLSCVNPGDNILILVASNTANEGTFDITVNANMPACTYTNDVCETTAEDLGVLVTGDPCITAVGCNDLACTEGNTGGCPTFINTVFYTFTTDANADDAFLNVEVLNGEGGELDAPGVMIFEGTCASLIQLGSCFSGGGGTVNSGPVGGVGVITANTTYTVVVANTDDTQNGGTFDLCITVTAGCVNDACNDAFEITGLSTGSTTTITEPASTSNCTMDVDCGNNSISTAWYRFTTPSDASSFDVEISNATSSVSVQIGLYDCANPTVELSNCNVSGPVTLECALPDTEYFVLVGSLDGASETDFEISITPNAPDIPNDVCSGALPLNVDMFCEFMDFNGSTRGACPENGTADGCDYSISPVTWYQFTTPPDLISNVSMEVIGALPNPFFGIFTDCGPPLTFISGFGCNTALTNGIPLASNTTYYVAVGSTTAGAEGDFTLRIRIDVPPPNDTPDLSSQTPPIDLSGGGSHSGTTCCAIGFNDDPTQDLRNQACSGAFDDDAVWYVFTPDGASQGVEITVNAGSIGAGSVEVYNGGNAGPLVGSSCTFPADIRIGCAPNLGTLWIKVASTEVGCGTFDINVSDVNPTCMYNDDCADATPVALTTDLQGVISYDCGRSCLDLACPDLTEGGACLTNQGPTAWYAFDLDADAAQLFVQVISNDGSWQPSFVIYSGTCGGGLTQLGDCNTADTTPDVLNVGVTGNQTVYVAVTAVDPSTIVDPEFTICGAAIVNTIACIGGVPPDFTPDCAPQAMFTVNSRSLDPDGSLGLPLEGPFCPEEVVNVCLEFLYDATATGQDWLHGIIPIFGDGWDTNAFDPSAITPTPAGAVWFPEGTTNFMETMPNLCTYVDPNSGLLVACNTFCQACPCTNPLPAGSPVPGAWFWNSPGTGPDCNGSGLPMNSFGIGSTTANVNFCIDLPVRMFATESECNAASLEFGFQATSDGATGCWDDPLAECLQDVAQLTSFMLDCRVAPEVQATPNPASICSGDQLDIFVETVMDPDGRDIDVIVEDNPNVSGENLAGFTFTGGAGTIDDILTVNPGVTTPQIVIYRARSIVPNQVCPGNTLEIEVTVYPQMEVTFDPNSVLICPDACATLNPIIMGGTGTYTDYIWAPNNNIDDITSPNPEVCPLFTTQYTVTVTDDLGCTGTGVVTVEVTERVEIFMNPEVQDICQVLDGVNDIYDVYAEVTAGIPPFTYQWNGPNNLDGNNGDPFTDFVGDTYHINEEFSDISAGVPFELYVTVTDANGCTNEALALININDAPTAFIDLPTAACGVTEVEITGTGQQGVSGNQVANTSIWSCDGIQLATSGSDMVSYTANLLDYDCFYVLVEDFEGCSSRTPDSIITISTAVEIVFDGDSVLCDGEAGTIAVANASDYVRFEWAPNGETSSSISIENGVTTYTVTATAADSCVSVNQFEVVFNPNPDVQISGSASFCEGTSTTLNGGGDTLSNTFVWQGPGGFTSNEQIITVIDSGQYTLTITDILGCIGFDTILVAIQDSLNPVISGGAMCDSSAVILSSTGFETYQWFDPSGMDLGIDNDSITVTVPGIYRVSVTNQGCSGSGTFEVINNETPMVDVQDTVFVCAVDGEDQTLDFTTLIVGDSGVWSQVELNGPDLSDLTDVDFEGLGIGTYTFVYRDTVAIAPCTNQRDTMRVLVVRPSAATFVPDPLCNDNGMQILEELENTSNPGQWTLISGPAGNTVDISSGVFDATGQQAGDYLLEFVIDPILGTNCQSSSQQTITVFDAPSIIPSGVDNTVCNAMTGGNVTTFDLATLLDPASSPGTWAQTGGAPIALTGTVLDADGLMQGEVFTFTYTTVNDPASPCAPISLEFEVEVINCLCPEARLDPIPSICNDQGPLDLEQFLTSNRPGSWSTPTMPSPITGATFDPSGLTSGPYTIYYIFDMQIQGCPDTLEETLVVRAAPLINFNSFTAPCNQDVGQGPTTVNLNDISSGSSPGTWVQVPNGSPMLTIEADGTVNFINQMDQSEFVFEYTTTSEGPSSPCQNISDQITIIVVNCSCDNPSIEDVVACNNDGDFDLSIMTTPTTDPGSFRVLDLLMSDLPVSGTIVNVDGLPAGTYSVIYTLDVLQSGVCPQADTVSLTISALPSAVLLTSQDVCTVDTGANSFIVDLNTFITGGDNTGVFLDDMGNVVVDPSNVSFLGEQNGQTYTYEYVLPGDAVCDSVFYTFTINTVDCDCPLIQPLEIPDVCADQLTYDLSPFNDPNQPGQWQSTDLSIANDVVDLNGVLPGQYTVTYVIDNQEPNCDFSRDRTINVIRPDNAGVATDPLRICLDDAQVVTLSDLFDGEDQGGTWTETSMSPSTGGAFDALAGTFNTQGQLANQYLFTYSFTGTPPCPPTSQVVEIVIEELPVADAGADDELTCDITTITIGGNSTTGANIAYVWIYDDGVNPVSEVGNGSTYEATLPGTYTLTVTNTNTNCSDSDEVVITQDEATPQIEVTSTPISCFNVFDATITIEVTGGGQAPYTFSIDGGASNVGLGVFTQLGPGTYDVLVTDAQGCTTPEQVIIAQKQATNVDVGDNVGIEINTDTVLSFTTNIPLAELANVTWTQDGVVVCQGVENCQTYRFTADFEASSFCVEVEDINGCTDEDCLTVVTRVVRNISVPNIFSPATDGGENNSFFINSSSVEVINKMLIYDRWGELMFEARDIPPNIPNVGWDGLFNGEAVNPGVYVYVIEVTYKDSNNEREILKGDITVIR